MQGCQFRCRQAVGSSAGAAHRPQSDEFSDPTFKPLIQEQWRLFLEKGEQQGTLQLLGPDGGSRPVEYIAKGNVLPVRHLVVLRDKKGDSPSAVPRQVGKGPSKSSIPGWVQDYALFLFDADGHIVAWYSGAERIYGYKSDEAVGRHLSLLYANGSMLLNRLAEESKRAAVEGHFGNEGWQSRKDGARFWANVIRVALKDENGDLQGFARVVRDFSDRHERDEILRRGRICLRPVHTESTIVGIVSGEFDRIPEANDAFLDLAGYSREDLVVGRLRWSDMTPPEYLALDQLAHQEGLRFGACTPFEKELIRKDGTRVPVMVATAVLKLSPFKWITFVQDLRERDRMERVEEAVEVNHDFEEIIGSSAAMKRVMGQVALVAPTDATVLILGETGTGKELVARAVHRMSPRKNLPFVTLNCAAIPTGLWKASCSVMKEELSRALCSRRSADSKGHTGELCFWTRWETFLWICSLSLLRALQEKAFERLGGLRRFRLTSGW
jgi:formate hydrogenlyase transcriptional activator